jgi:hypothetical protein
MSFLGTTWPSSLTSPYYVVALKSHLMYYVLDLLCFRHTKSKTFCLQSLSPQIQLLVNPRPTLIHQNHIIHKEYASKDTTLYVSCDSIHHQSIKDKGLEPTRDQSFPKR